MGDSLITNDSRKSEKLQKILSGLDSSQSHNVYRCLVEIRTKFATNDGQKAKSLVSMGLVAKLIPLLERPNSKIVDVTLSILGNLTLHRKPREKLLECGGVEALYTILTTLNEGNILGRGSRVVGNAAQDRNVCAKLLSIGVLGALIKNLAEVSAPAAKSSVIRAIRILGSHDMSRAREILSLNVLSNVSQCLYSDFEELLKSSVKCLATFSAMICTYEMATQIQGGEGKGFIRLVELCGSHKSSVWEAALATLVNLSQLENLRPILGNAGAVAAIINKINLFGSSMKSPTYLRSIRALCRYSRESVNRMKLRESGGLKLFVRILSSRTSVDVELHDCVIESIKNFAYDNTSLMMFQNEGLILALVQFVEDFVDENYHVHSCEEEICESDKASWDSTSKNPQEELSTIEAEGDSITNDEFEAEQIVEINQPIDAPDIDVETPSTSQAAVSESIENVDTQNVEPENEAGPSNVEKDLKEEEVVEERIKELKQFRVNSPSYQAVQDEILAFSRLRNEYVCVSPSVSLFSSNFPSPERFSPPESLQSSPFQSPDRSDLDSSDMDMDLEDESSDRPYDEARYSPVEFMSDDESSNVEASNQETSNVGTSSSAQPSTPSAATAATAQPQTVLSPPRQRPRFAPSAPLSPLQYLAPTSPSTSNNENSMMNFSFGASSLNASSSSSNKKKDDPHEGRMGEVLLLLSRLTQFEVPHDNLFNLKTSKALVNYLCYTLKPSSRAERILLRLSKNLYCLMPFIHQCQLSWLKLEVSSRQSLPDSSCQSCQNLQDFTKQLITNFSFLAETGYAEGTMCHTLVKGILSEKQTIAVGIPLLIRPRKLLRNVLLAHGGLDILMEVLENESTGDELFSHAVLSVKTLSEHVGIVSPELKLVETFDENTNCYFEGSLEEKDLIVKLDSEETVEANRAILSNESCVFEAMFSGDFAESNQSGISIKLTSKPAIVALFHYLYGCRNCIFLRHLDVNTLVELVSLSDKFLVSDFNRTISGRIVRQCLVTDQVVGIYEQSLQNSYPVLGLDESLNICTTSFVLVGSFGHRKRVEIFRELVRSKMCSDFIDDVTKTITQKL